MIASCMQLGDDLHAMGNGGLSSAEAPAQPHPRTAPTSYAMEVVPEDRVVGQDRLVDALRQLRPVGGAVVDGVVDGREGGSLRG
ncbi:hypothetical protein GCM10019016_126910 [Streptomyces prasinosporus]|uniref:Uncharacterized protein n=1 Tax=Streptomyces prasinosporus TaxID=68256 RepID=A0ABP6UCT6_9ACTN